MCFELMMETCILASYRVIHSGNTGTTEVINSAIFSHRPHTMFRIHILCYKLDVTNSSS